MSVRLNRRFYGSSLRQKTHRAACETWLEKKKKVNYVSYARLDPHYPGWLAGAPPLSCSCNCNLRRQSCRGRIRDGPHRPLRTTRKPPHPRKSTLNTPLFESSVLRCGVFQADAKKAAEVRESRRRREEGGLPRPR